MCIFKISKSVPIHTDTIFQVDQAFSFIMMFSVYV